MVQDIYPSAFFLTPPPNISLFNNNSYTNLVPQNLIRYGIAVLMATNKLLAILDDCVTQLHPSNILKTDSQSPPIPSAQCWQKAYIEDLDTFRSTKDERGFARRTYALLVHFINQVFTYYKSLAPAQKQLADFYLTVLDQMLQLKKIFHHITPSLFNPLEEPVSRYELYLFNKQYKKQLGQMQQLLLAHFKKEEVALLFYPLTLLQSVDHPNRHLLSYVNTIIRHLNHWLTNKPFNNRARLVEFLVCHNINSSAATTYVYNYIEQELSSKSSDLLRCQQLKSWQGQLLDIPEITIALNPHKTSLPCLTDHYVNAKLSKLCDACSAAATVREMDASDQLGKEQAIHSRFSVPQMAIFLVLCIKVGIFSSNTLTSIFRRIAAIFVTRKDKTFSFDSLYKQAYNMQTSSKKVVRDTLREMIKLLDEPGLSLSER